jgi:pseudoazurin
MFSVPEPRPRIPATIKPELALAQRVFRVIAVNHPRTGKSVGKTWRMTMRKLMMLATAAVLMTMAGGAFAAEVEVKMLNKGTEGGMMVFEPALVKIAPGDTVKFVATDKGHNVESIKGMLPADAAPIAGKSGEDLSVTLDKPGVYGVKCLPHYGMGMVAMIVVGTPANLDEAKAAPQIGKAKQVMAGLFDRLAAQTAAK